MVCGAAQRMGYTLHQDPIAYSRAGISKNTTTWESAGTLFWISRYLGALGWASRPDELPSVASALRWW